MARKLSSAIESAEKGRRNIARKYQLELCQKALGENVLVFWGSGCGKTHIAVLLTCELGHLLRKPQTSVCIFLVPTEALVQKDRVMMLRTFLRCFSKMGRIALLMSHKFHHAQVNGNHPYAEIVRVLYKADVPQLFGMTTSTMVGKVT